MCVRHEKRARRQTARPEPTIYGNCESWALIVGKKAKKHSPAGAQAGMLQCNNMNFMHNLFTTGQHILGITFVQVVRELWTDCGPDKYISYCGFGQI
jgi:aspartate/glutamate racemase